MASVSIQKQAYKKSLLHSCKYATEEVVGALIGTIKDNVYKVVDSFPLFHSRVLQCPLELAFQLIEANLQQDQKIIGIYEAKTKNDGKVISDLGRDILESITNHFPKNDKAEAIYMKISEIEEDDGVCTRLITQYFTLNEQRRIEEKNQPEYQVIKDSLKQAHHWNIIDFDAHFENVALDFNNKYLND